VREVDHSPPPITVFRKGRALPPFPHISSWHRA
jgi:hypothetical protein